MAKRSRNPSFPIISLDVAISRARALHDQEKTHPTPRAVAFKHWGYSGKSSMAQQTVAALKAYGLVTASQGNVQLTPAALNIILDTRDVSPDRDAEIRRAALRPPLFRQMWKAHSREGGLPSDETFKTNLRLKQGFMSERAAVDFIRVYKETMAFAGADESGTISTDEAENGDAQSDAAAVSVEVGDLIQWESKGVLQFPEPLLVRGINDDGQWVFVEGSETGIPVGEVEVVQRHTPTGATMPETQTAAVPPTLAIDQPAKTGLRRDVFTLDEGDAVLQWPGELSADSFEDFSGWLKLVERKARRVAGVDADD